MGCFNCLKYILIITNLTRFIFGGAFIGMGAIMASGVFHEHKLVQAILDGQTITCIACGFICYGVLLCTTAIVGWMATCTEKKYKYFTVFVGFMLLIIVCEIGSGAAVLLSKNHIRCTGLKALHSLIQKVYGNDIELTEFWDEMQIKYECCGGMRGVEDWNTSSWSMKQGFDQALNLSEYNSYQIPQSCCLDPHEYPNCYSSGNYFKKPCGCAFKKFFASYITYTQISTVCIIVHEILLVVFALILRQTLKTHAENVKEGEFFRATFDKEFAAMRNKYKQFF